jgi:hypothetical protein
MERSIILYFESINIQQKAKILTPLQKLQADNARRREGLDLSREKLADRKSTRAIIGAFAYPYLGGRVKGHTINAMPNKSLDMAGKLAQGQQYLEKPVRIPQW